MFQSLCVMTAVIYLDKKRDSAQGPLSESVISI
nr:MAG TPA: hypothetical protein [Caudoviricetes sp.]